MREHYECCRSIKTLWSNIARVEPTCVKKVQKAIESKLDQFNKKWLLADAAPYIGRGALYRGSNRSRRIRRITRIYFVMDDWKILILRKVRKQKKYNQLKNKTPTI